jgi:hypothetical protein
MANVLIVTMLVVMFSALAVGIRALYRMGDKGSASVLAGAWLVAVALSTTLLSALFRVEG